MWHVISIGARGPRPTRRTSDDCIDMRRRRRGGGGRDRAARRARSATDGKKDDGARRRPAAPAPRPLTRARRRRIVGTTVTSERWSRPVARRPTSTKFGPIGRCALAADRPTSPYCSLSDSSRSPKTVAWPAGRGVNRAVAAHFLLLRDRRAAAFCAAGGEEMAAHCCCFSGCPHTASRTDVTAHRAGVCKTPGARGTVTCPP